MRAGRNPYREYELHFLTYRTHKLGAANDYGKNCTGVKPALVPHL